MTDDLPPARTFRPTGPAAPPHIIYIVHGIRQHPIAANAWMNRLAAVITAASPTAWVRLHMWGFLGAMPWRLSRRVRRAQVRRLQQRIADDRVMFPNATIDAIGHSAGTYLLWHAMTQEGAPRAIFRRLVFMGGIVSSRETFERQIGHVDSLLNLYSREDEVVAVSTFGQSGWHGFKEQVRPFAEPHLHQMDMTPFEHDHYERHGAAWQKAVEFLTPLSSS